MKRIFLLTGLILIGINLIFSSCNTGKIPGTEKTSDPIEKNDIDKVIDTPQIDFIEISSPQPHETSTNTIWYDDFSIEKDYLESTGTIDKNVKFGTTGGSMEAGFKIGQQSGDGNRKLAFGDFPSSAVTAKKGQKFDVIYWRLYIKHEFGWEGSPKKMSRATSIVSNKWTQAMIAHVWSGSNNSLTLDPARGVIEQTDQIATTKYNDFNNLKWLGNSPSANYPIFNTKESGYWVLVEAMAKLNTPGKNDGISKLWIDGRLEAQRKNLNFRGSYTKHGINAVFLETYWNEGSVKTQGRWYDNFVVSTEQIGPVICPSNPILHKTPYYGPGELATWEVEIATDYNGTDKVFRSNWLEKTESVKIETRTGNFIGSLEGKTTLSSGKTYFCRVRQKSSNQEWSNWSRWHQGFVVE